MMNEDKISFGFEGKTIVYAEVSGYCNSHCVVCPYETGARTGFITNEIRDRIIQFVKENVNTRFLFYFHWISEPLIYKGLEEYIKLLSALPNADLWVCTNGVLLTEDRINSLREAGLKNIWYSMFKNNEAEYNEFTRSRNYQTSRKNLIYLLDNSLLFEKIFLTTFSKDFGDLEDHVERTPNIIPERDRTILKWAPADGQKNSCICISHKGDINFMWEDYDRSIGNIKDFDSVTLLNAFSAGT